MLRSGLLQEGTFYFGPKKLHVIKDLHLAEGKSFLLRAWANGWADGVRFTGQGEVSQRMPKKRACPTIWSLHPQIYIQQIRRFPNLLCSDRRICIWCEMMCMASQFFPDLQGSEAMNLMNAPGLELDQEETPQAGSLYTMCNRNMESFLLSCWF